MIHSINIFKYYINFYDYLHSPFLISNIKSTLLFLIGIFLFIFFITLKRDRSNKFYDIFSINNTDQIRGLAIIIILLSHITYKLFQIHPPVDIFANFGQYGVDIFLILSGFGITSSYLNKGFGKFWLLKKAIRIYIPYLLVTLIWVSLDLTLYKINHNTIDLLEILLGFNFKPDTVQIDSNMWFIFFIIFQYILFYFVFISKGLKLGLKLILFTLIESSFIVWGLKFSIKYPQFIGFHDKFDMYSLFFPIGILLAINYKSITRFIKTLERRYIILLFAGIILISYLQTYKLAVSNFIWGAVFFISIIILLTSINLKSRFLKFIGIISYELYLVHGPLMYRYDFILFRGPFFITFLAYIIFAIISAYILYLISEFIINKLYSLLTLYKAILLTITRKSRILAKLLTN